MKFSTEMVAARKLGPEDYGIWSIMFLITTYATNLHLGIINGLGRDIPFYLGQRNNDLIKQIKCVGIKVILATILIFAFFIFAYIHFLNRNQRHENAFILLIAYFIGYQLHQYTQYVLRAELKFNKASGQQAVTGVLIAVITIHLLIKWQLNGLIIGYAIPLFIGAFLFGTWGDFRTSKEFKVNTAVLLRLLKIGFPIMAIGFLYMIVTSVDRWVVVIFLGVEQMGYYSFAYNIFLGGLLFLSLLAKQFYPRLSFVYGKTNSKLAVANLLEKQIVLMLVFAVLASISISVLLPHFVRLLIPGYIPSLAVARILLISLPFIGVALVISGYFNVICEQRYLLLPMILAITINLSVSLLLIWAGFGKKGVAVSTLGSYALYCLLIYRNFFMQRLRLKNEQNSNRL